MLAVLTAGGAAAVVGAGGGAELWTWREVGDGLPRAGQWRHGFDLADVDGDGRLDLVHGPPRKQPGRPWIFAGDGDGGFSPLGEQWFADLSISYGDAAAADFDGDGRLDLAFAAHLERLAVLLARPGGGFAEPAESSRRPELGFPSRALEVGDLDGDGRADLAAIGEGSRLGSGRAASGVRVLLNRLPARWRAVDLAPAAGRLFGDAIVVADLDGDGRPDIATDSRVQGQLGVVFWNAGDGRFAPAPLAAGRAGGYLHAVAAADFDGSGRAALAVAYLVPRGAGARVGVDLFAAGADRTWRRRELAWPAEGGRPTALAAGDPDGDADADLVALTDSGAVVVFANREGKLTPAAGLAAPRAGRGCSGYHVHLADLDGDGADEIVAGFAGEDCPGGGSLRAWTLEPAR